MDLIQELLTILGRGEGQPLPPMPLPELPAKDPSRATGAMPGGRFSDYQGLDDTITGSLLPEGASPSEGAMTGLPTPMPREVPLPLSRPTMPPFQPPMGGGRPQPGPGGMPLSVSPPTLDSIVGVPMARAPQMAPLNDPADQWRHRFAAGLKNARSPFGFTAAMGGAMGGVDSYADQQQKRKLAVLNHLLATRKTETAERVGRAREDYLLGSLEDKRTRTNDQRDYNEGRLGNQRDYNEGRLSLGSERNQLTRERDANRDVFNQGKLEIERGKLQNAITRTTDERTRRDLEGRLKVVDLALKERKLTAQQAKDAGLLELSGERNDIARDRNDILRNRQPGSAGKTPLQLELNRAYSRIMGPFAKSQPVTAAEKADYAQREAKWLEEEKAIRGSLGSGGAPTRAPSAAVPGPTGALGRYGNPHKPTTREDFDKIRPGEVYINPADGKPYVKSKPANQAAVTDDTDTDDDDDE